jgi:small subunit ribosomal protein S1
MTSGLAAHAGAGPALAKNGMKELLGSGETLFSFPREGDIIEGLVIKKGRNRIYFNLGALRTGVVYRSEIDMSLYDVEGLHEGQTLPVKILSLENEEGFVELSLREAGLDKTWQELRMFKEKGEAFSFTVEAANRGGLMGTIRGVAAFLPVSQLSPEHYPRVEGGDKEEIFRQLKEFVGREIEVKILDLNQKTNKLILSEKAKASHAIEEKLAGYSVGQVVEGTVSGIVDFGAFVTFDGIEGLVHISELGWQLVEDPRSVVSIGETVQAKVIAIEGDRVSLSLKVLKPNPWEEIARTYKKGDIVEGVVSKFNPFGVFVRVGAEVQGLAHISEFKNYEEMTARLEVGKTYQFRITMLEPENYKMALRLLELEAERGEGSAEVAHQAQETLDPAAPSN